MIADADSTLDCQDCGKVLRKLTQAEAQMVACNPYNFILFCSSCKRAAEMEPQP